MSLPKLECLSRLSHDDIQKWLELNIEVNSRTESKAWIEAAFSACRRLGIEDEPSMAHTLIVATDIGERVSGLIVSSETKILACLTVVPHGGFRLDLEQTRALQHVRPGHVVALLLAGQAAREGPRIYWNETPEKVS
jgi:hypothetical protein